MNDALLKLLQRDLKALTRRAVAHRIGEVTAISPLTISLGGATETYVGVRQLAGPTYWIGDVVSVLMWGNDLLVIGKITAAPRTLPLSGAGPWSFTGLDGEADRGYELTWDLFFTSGAQHAMYLRPNGDSSGVYSGVMQRFYHTGAAYTGDGYVAGAAVYPWPNGLLIGGFDWALNGTCVGRALFAAKQHGASQLGRPCSADWTFRAASGTQAYIMRGFASYYWNVMTTPVTSLTIMLTGGTAVGQFTLKPTGR